MVVLGIHKLRCDRSISLLGEMRLIEPSEIDKCCHLHDASNEFNCCGCSMEGVGWVVVGCDNYYISIANIYVLYTVHFFSFVLFYSVFVAHFSPCTIIITL